MGKKDAPWTGSQGGAQVWCHRVRVEQVTGREGAGAGGLLWDLELGSSTQVPWVCSLTCLPHKKQHPQWLPVSCPGALVPRQRSACPRNQALQLTVTRLLCSHWNWVLFLLSLQRPTKGPQCAGGIALLCCLNMGWARSGFSCVVLSALLPQEIP